MIKIDMRFRRSQSKDAVSFSTILKTIMVVSSPSLLLLSFYVFLDELNFSYFIFGYMAVVLASAVFVVPFLSNIATLTSYVTDLAADKRVRAPDLSFLSNIGRLSEALGRLQNSWENKRHAMETVIYLS